MIDAVPGIPYQFKDLAVLRLALTHKSAGSSNYERLEFLGDSLLNLVVSIRLFEAFPQASEGDLSRMRARIVRGKTLAEVAAGLSLGDYLRLGEGEKKSGGFRRASTLADALEALLGAIYLDGGFDACRAVILELCDPLISGLPPANELKDPKTRLQEWLQGSGKPLPVYKLEREEGAEHAKSFFVSCSLRDPDLRVVSSGKSRRKAEQSAAEEVLGLLPRAGK